MGDARSEGAMWRRIKLLSLLLERQDDVGDVIVESSLIRAIRLGDISE